MLKSCKYCGRIHDKYIPCDRKPISARGKYSRCEEEAGRYTRSFAEKSRSIKERSLWLCAVCLAKGVISNKHLEAHHIIKLRDRPDLLLDDGNLICLCGRCHGMADLGQIDADYLRDLARERDDGTPRGADLAFLASVATDSPIAEEEKFPK